MNTTHHELPILVTGAAGRLGLVGHTVTELLLARGFRVRAHVRVDDERAAKLRDLGAEIVVGDLLDIMAVHRAIEGCERVCFGMSVAPTYLEAAANVAVVAKHHDVKAFVNLSQMTVKEMDIFDDPQPAAEAALVGRADPVLVRAAGRGGPTDGVHGGFFLQNAKSISTQNKILAPFGKGKNSAIAAVDVARVIAEILSDPRSTSVGPTI